MKEITKEEAQKKVKRILLKKAIDAFSMLIWEKVLHPEKVSEELLSKISGLFVAISIALEE